MEPDAYRPTVNTLNPNVQSRIVTLLQSGAVMDRKYQTYESHIPYLHQFFIDHNLFGMDYIHLKDGRFRMPVYGESCRASLCSKKSTNVLKNQCRY